MGHQTTTTNTIGQSDITSISSMEMTTETTESEQIQMNNNGNPFVHQQDQRIFINRVDTKKHTNDDDLDYFYE